MRNIWNVFRKEFAGYVNSPSTYIFLVIFLVMGSCLLFFVSEFFRFDTARLDGFFVFVPWLFLFLVPAVAMRVWSEEKKSGTQELLLTLPVKDHEVVVGKYLAALTLIAVALALTFPLPVMVSTLADPKTPVDPGPIWCAYFGSLLLGGTILAIGVWVSSLTENQIIAFIVCAAISFVLILLGVDRIAENLPFGVGQTLSHLSPYRHFTSMYKGVLDLADVVYYLAAIGFFLFLNIRSIESRKWA